MRTYQTYTHKTKTDEVIFVTRRSFTTKKMEDRIRWMRLKKSLHRRFRPGEGSRQGGQTSADFGMLQVIGIALQYC